MSISPLQKVRLGYQPKLPLILQNDIHQVAVKYGKETESVSDQAKIKAMFPNTYGMKEISFEKATSTASDRKQVVGVILSGGSTSTGTPAASTSSDPDARSSRPSSSSRSWNPSQRSTDLRR